MGVIYQTRLLSTPIKSNLALIVWGTYAGHGTAPKCEVICPRKIFCSCCMGSFSILLEPHSVHVVPFVAVLDRNSRWFCSEVPWLSLVFSFERIIVPECKMMTAYQTLTLGEWMKCLMEFIGILSSPAMVVLLIYISIKRKLSLVIHEQFIGSGTVCLNSKKLLQNSRQFYYCCYFLNSGHFVWMKVNLMENWSHFWLQQRKRSLTAVNNRHADQF